MKVLIVTPNAADGVLAAGFLAERAIDARTCATLADLAAYPMDEIGAFLLVEEALPDDDIHPFQDAIAAQPAWSDVPLLLIAGQDTLVTGMVENVFPRAGNVTVLQRPLEPVSLVSSVLAALRARQRQFEVRELLAQREDALRKRDEFLAMLAHELRNPLAPIRNAVYLLGSLKIEDPLFVTCRAMIEKQSIHITRLVDDLLDVSRLELGKVDLRLQRVDLNQAVIAAAEASLSGTRAQRHTVNLHAAPEPLPIEADAVRIEQIFGNLIVNASKFTPAGGEITIAARREGDEAVVTVSDTGKGIEPALIDSVFELFVQGDSTLARTQGGLGIGLTLVRRLVGLHNGTVRAMSAGANQGATFEVRFPLAPAASAAAPGIERGGRAQRPKRVLVVEDSSDIRESLGLLMTAWSHEVSFAETGLEGISLARTLKPDVALIDIGLPGVDGYEVARSIRGVAAPWASQVKLIALTGYGQAEDQSKAIAAGFDVHLLKPVDPARLEALLGD